MWKAQVQDVLTTCSGSRDAAQTRTHIEQKVAVKDRKKKRMIAVLLLVLAKYQSEHDRSRVSLKCTLQQLSHTVHTYTYTHTEARATHRGLIFCDLRRLWMILSSSMVFMQHRLVQAHTSL